MNEHKQRIAIAEACGWKHVGKYPYVWRTKEDIPAWESEVPDYLNDLNAMHEAEKSLQALHKSRAFCENVNVICMRAGIHPVHASASQRAEAFLRTLNLWKDN